jgi:hypothetical protein
VIFPLKYFMGLTLSAQFSFVNGMGLI